MHGMDRTTASSRIGATLCLLALALPACGSGRSANVPTVPSTQPAAPSGAWMLVFNDDFDSDGPPDASKWGYELGYIRNDEKQYYTSRPENARVEGRKEEYRGYSYTSASLNTLGKFEFTYGRVEVRAKLPTGNGAWPAIWMLGVNRTQVGWPTCGEIDIMENVGFDPRRIHGSVHTAAYNHTIQTQKTASVTVSDPWSDFHTYAMAWHADRIEVSVDGQVYFTFRNEQAGARTWPFDKPQYLLVNFAIGGGWGGQKGIDETRFPQKFLIDYVRIYQQK
jgi:beta-glucanase (GH16 family)